MIFDEEEEWDIDLIDNLVRKEEEAIAARRGSQALPLTQPPLPFLRAGAKQGKEQPLKKYEEHFPGAGPPSDEQKRLVSELQRRLLEAENEVSELRKKTQPIIITSSKNDQELERLREQILFKDQEILEARKAWAEKSEELKRSKSELQELRKQFEENSLLAKRQPEVMSQGGALKICNTSAVGIQGASSRDVWYPPWTISGTGGGSKLNGSSIVQLQTIAERTLESSAVEELKLRTRDYGSTLSLQNEVKNTGRHSQQEDAPKVSDLYGQNRNRIRSEHAYWEKLHKIWYPQDIKGDCMWLITKLFTVCQGDIDILLSKQARDSEMHQGVIKADCAVSGALDLHSILVKMANGFLSSWSLFIAVLELCESENMQILESALHILHCILIHDDGCRKKIFGRALQQDAQLVGNIFVDECFGDHTREIACSSPRVYVVSETQVQDNKRSADDCNSSPKTLRSCEMEKDGQILSKEKSHAALSMKIFKLILSKAKNCGSQAARTTAMSILVAVLMNTEPINMRETFGFILFDGSIAHFLTKSRDMELRLQTVRLVHILLHCPMILKKLCTSEGKESQPVEAIESQRGSDMRGNTGPECNTGPSGMESCLHVDRSLKDQPVTADTTIRDDDCVDVLKGLISCLIVGGSGLTACSLPRTTLRVLTFLATSGQEGALFLFRKKVNLLIQSFSVEGKDGDDVWKKNSSVVPCSLPLHLISLLDQQLKAVEDETIRITELEEREFIIRDALTLVCRLVSNPVVSVTALGALTANKAFTRWSISVVNRLISRGTLLETLQLQGKHVIASADMVELSHGLRRRILACASNC